MNQGGDGYLQYLCEEFDSLNVQNFTERRRILVWRVSLEN